MAALTGKERDQVPKSLLNVRLIIIPPRTAERGRERERERHGRACKRLMRDRERVLESRVSTAFLGNSESQNLRKGKGIILNDMPI